MYILRFHWFDYVLASIRALWFIGRLKDIQSDPEIMIVNDSGMIISDNTILFILYSISFGVPLILFLINRVPRFVVVLSELLCSGGVFLYIAYDFESAFGFYGIPIFTIGYVSRSLTTIFSTVGVILLPILAQIIWHYSIEQIINETVDAVILLFLGYCFGKMKDSFIKVKQMNDVIHQQNQMLEVNAKQIERLTIAEERNRLARELHDTVGHTFTTTIVGMDAVYYLIDVAPEEAKKNLRQLLHVTRNGLDEVRRHIHAISSEPNEQLLSSALSQIANEFSLYTGTQVLFRKHGAETPVSEMVRMTLIRCLQESLTNATRHGFARNVEVVLTFQTESLHLQIIDDGKGTDKIIPGFGLNNMADRLTNINATLDIHSTLNQGTQIFCSVPLPKHNRRSGYQKGNL